ncbi:MAG: class I SAM-dependent methyltransferase [Clostridiales bacterium]|jgi:SAM-dependent methyltransferase|nr:class I SAM-dependent methyltransferase [Clostridiales bacterium]
MEMNSKEYWERRFAEKDWENSSGRQQSAYFARLFAQNAPEWLTRYVNGGNYSVVDLGCAEGDGTAVLTEIFTGAVSGIDFSESAVRTAKTLYPRLSFAAEDIRNLSGGGDVAFISNVLEHFEDPSAVLSAVAKRVNHAIIVLVPFEESPLYTEHVFSFHYHNIPVEIADFRLVYFNGIARETGRSYYDGRQMMLIYVKNEESAAGLLNIEAVPFVPEWGGREGYSALWHKVYGEKSAPDS